MRVGNFLKVVAVIAGGLLVSAIVVNRVKKELAAERKTKENSENPEEDDGPSGDSEYPDSTSEKKPEEIIKNIIVKIKKSPDWDVSRIMIQKGIEFDAHTIHVHQSIRDLDFLLEIPRLDSGNYNLPEMRDFINEFKDSTNYIWNIVKYSEKPFGVLEGYLVLSYEYNNDPLHERRFMYGKLSREIVSRFRKPGVQEKDSWVLTRCISEIRKSLDNKEVSVINVGSNTDDKINVKIEDVKLFWRISFRIRLGSSMIGITADTAEKCLKYLIDKMEIVGSRNKTYRYEQIIFYKCFDDEVEAYEPVETEEGKFKIESFLLDFGEEK